MSTIRLKPALPYTGLPIIAVTLLILCQSRMGPLALLQYEMLIIFGYVAAILDLKTKRIPNSLILAMFAAWLFTIMPALLVDTGTATGLLKDSLFGFAFGGGLFFLVYIISHKGLGGGDVKFMSAAGMYLGFDGTIQVILFGSVVAALTGLTLILLKRIGRKDAMPLAPFLFIGILAAVFLGGLRA